MKKILYTLALAFGSMYSAFAEEMTVEVSNATELSAALEQYATRSDVTIKLTGDCIYGASLDVKKEFDKFCGTLEGGHPKLDDQGNVVQINGEDVIIPYTIKGLRKPLFDDLVGAKFRHLRFEDCSDPITNSWVTHESYILGEDATGCEFTDIILENCHYFSAWSSGTLGNLSENLGLLVGYMDNCQVTDVILTACSLRCASQDVGGIAGEAEHCTFTNCVADPMTKVFTSVSPNAYVGGLVGNSNDCTFTDCHCGAVVCASEDSDNVGGLTGISYLSTFTDCTYTGILSQASGATFNSYCGNVANVFSTWTIGNNFQLANYHVRQANYAYHAKMNPPFEDSMDLESIGWDEAQTSVIRDNMAKCIKSMAIALAALAIQVAMEVYGAQDPDEMGGMSGAAYGCTYERCENQGMVFCRDAYSGGIVGYASDKSGRGTVIRNCINNGYVQGREQVGGIVGKLDNSQVYNCINTGTVDAIEETQGPIYGDRDNASDSPVQGCFALTHGAENISAVDGSQEVYNISLMDVKGGRAAYEMNRIVGSDIFRQNVGKQFYPSLNNKSKVVTAGDVRDDVELIFKAKDRDEFALALFYQYSDIELEDDIDFGQSYFSLYRRVTPFRGSIDGKGHAIKNMKIDTDDAGDGVGKWDWGEADKAYFGLIVAAENATFKNLTISDFSITLPNRVSVLVGHSMNCKYENVHLAGNSYVGARWWVGGIVYESKYDRFTGCTVGKDCTVDGRLTSLADHDSDAGAIASQAKSSMFIDCVNNGDVWASTDGAGGIVADCSEDCRFIRCINNGHVAHSSQILNDDDEVGGIAATAEDCRFFECVNNGRITCHDEYGGGIVGRGVSCTLSNCLNTTTKLDYMGLDFGSSTCGGIIGEAKNCLINNCCSYADYALLGNSSVFGNNDESGYNFSVSNNGRSTSKYEHGVTSKEMRSGLVAQYLNTNNSQGTDFWRQNLYAHDGMEIDDYPTFDPAHDIVNMESRTRGTAISSAKELMDFAKRVNEGEKDQFASAHLTADIDMDGYDWTPIGNTSSYGQWRGIFDGRGHKIKNLKVNSSSAAGLFGVAHVGAEIHNLIIDESCEFTCSGNDGVGGILGEVNIGWDWGYVRIENCANYGKVTATGTVNAGGILGLVKNTTSDNVKVYVTNCYNMGTVTVANGNSALLCGYLKNSGVVSNCWSGGLLLSSTSMKPYEPTHDEYFAGYDSRIDIQNCYSIDAENNVQGATWQTSQAGVLDLYQSHVLEGQLTYRLNGNTNDVSQSLTWQQNLGVDALPEWGSKGVYHTRTVSESSKGYGTLCLPYDVKSDDEILYYTFSEATDASGEVKLNFDYAEEVPAGTPVLFRVQNAGEYSFYGAGGVAGNGWAYTANSSQTDTWQLHGTFLQQEFSGDDAQSIYYVSDGVIKNAAKVTIAPYRAYFNGPSIDALKSNQARVRIVIDGEEDNESGLQLVIDDALRGSSKSYTLFGTEAGEGYCGITIRNGKKVIL